MHKIIVIFWQLIFYAMIKCILKFGKILPNIIILERKARLIVVSKVKKWAFGASQIGKIAFFILSTDYA